MKRSAPLTKYVLLFLSFFSFNSKPAFAQIPEKPSSTKILQDLKRLNVLGNVLHIGAHPDDENTTFIAYMSNEKLYNTGYLALTRGDGGQNLIGSEIREGLGIIRTQELLQARRIDGGKQFFTRANDFGFSKNPDEVFTIWDKEQLLADVVWVIRNFKPDVVVTRFPVDSRAGHGQHSASSILAEEAFDAAGDPKRFPEQLQYIDIWQPKRLLWNVSNRSFPNAEEFNNYVKDFLSIDVGVYNPLLGKSYGEISAESRSMHQSQGMGTLSSRGTTIDYFQHTKGDKATKDLFEGVNTTWSRVKGGERVERIINKAIKEFNASNPVAVVPTLMLVRKELEKLPDSYWKKAKLEEIQHIIKEAMGLFIEVTASDFTATPGQLVNIQVEAINRSAVPVTLQKVDYSFSAKDTVINVQLPKNNGLNFNTTLALPATMPYSQLYWLRSKGTLGSFMIENQHEVGLPENKPAAEVAFTFLVAGMPMQFKVPVVYKQRDPVIGEVYRPFVITPPVFANITEKVFMFASQEPKTIQVLVKSGKQDISGNVKLDLPQGWRTEPANLPFNIKVKGGEQSLAFKVFPPQEQQEAEVRAIVTLDGKTYDKSLTVINYSHFPAQTYFPEATAKFVKLDLKKKGDQIAYIMGAGDDIPTSLQQIGYKVTLMTNEAMNLTNLEKFDAIILGVRAYNTVDRLKYQHDKLMDYVKNGGNLIVQYNTPQGLVTPNLGPYPFKISRDRVTAENSEVRFLKPEHHILNTPNKITTQDFNGWVQERGLYFPNEWSNEYEAIISANDPGEPARDGGILVAKYGKGNYIYTGYSWFRELPAGVPGAYRLFANLISLGK